MNDPDTVPPVVRRLAMKLASNALFIQQGLPIDVLVQQWDELRDAITEVLDIAADLPSDKTLVVTDPLPDPLMQIMADGFVAPDDISSIADEEGWE